LSRRTLSRIISRKQKNKWLISNCDDGIKYFFMAVVALFRRTRASYICFISTQRNRQFAQEHM
ncbi:hypothetical protein T4E_3122, partial [Trichinella pseudospiralis]